ncbi:Mercuric reductase [Corynebacterium ciconiae DSM 44920]|uniref:dihydrolipoyl dehydrogenase family protein n=1 Tax=Corynebacterium ciconiae TaxID=227319 RepID=UPI0003A57E87|nr:FAD-dependent oxidoreductase [Corynebacterium ciconiae]WKD61206.1 Mercuric reductase [Corynebacterium ciconiae DSM 44920]
MSDIAATAPRESMNVDVLVIGFGKAGKTIAMTRAAAGDKVALVEQSPSMYGGTCINIACVPTKTLLTDADRFAAGTGEEPDAAFAAAYERRDSLTSAMNQANYTMATSKGVVVIDGHASFSGPHTVEVAAGAERLEISAETIIINTGAVPFIPPIEGADGPRVVDSTGAQQLEERPQSVAVVGGGPIGCEFATLFARFGATVSILDQSETFFKAADRDVAEMLAEDLARIGITVISSAQVNRIDNSDNGATVHYSTPAGEDSLEVDVVLLATGRTPYTEGLNLEAAGIETTERGAIVVDEHLRTGVEGVYATGDVNGGPQFTYISYDDHRVVLSDRWGDGSRTTKGRIFPTTTFVEPPLAQIGLSEEQARAEVEERGHSLKVAAKKVADIPIMPRPKIVGTPEGMAKFLVDEDTDEILGATLYCIDSQELINTVAVAMNNGVSASSLGGGIYTHPSSSEVFNALLG